MKQKIPVKIQRIIQIIQTKPVFSKSTIVFTSFLQFGQYILHEDLGTEQVVIALIYTGAPGFTAGLGLGATLGVASLITFDSSVSID